MNKFKIAIIDSGIGGLSLLKTLALNLNVKKYIYFADLKNIPYGTKTHEQLLCITIKNVNFIIEKFKPDIIVFGCNTIGSTIFNDIKKIFFHQVFFAIKPDLKKINNKTLVIATNGTISALSKSNEFINNKNNIVLCKMPKLATKVENYIQNGANLVPYLKNKLVKYKGYKTIILGCTHYYFVKNIIKEILPDTQIIDGRLKVLKQIKSFLNKKFNNKNFLKINKQKLSKIKIDWFLTSNESNLFIYKKLASKLFKK